MGEKTDEIRLWGTFITFAGSVRHMKGEAVSAGKSSQLRRRGVTVIEVLVVTVIFMIIMLVTANTLILCMNTYRESDEATPVFRHAAEGVDIISNELRQCVKIYSPEEKTLNEGCSPGKESFVFVRLSPEETGEEVVGYRYDEGSKCVERLIYYGSYDPGKKESQRVYDRKTVIQFAGEMTLRRFVHLYDEFLQFECVITREGRTCTGIRKSDIVLRTKVKIQGGYRDED